SLRERYFNVKPAFTATRPDPSAKRSRAEKHLLTRNQNRNQDLTPFQFSGQVTFASVTLNFLNGTSFSSPCHVYPSVAARLTGPGNSTQTFISSCHHPRVVLP